MILKILRLSRKARLAKLDEKYLAKAGNLRDHVDKYDVLMNGTIDRLVRDHLVSAEMATSLMNDSSIAIQIARDLVDVSSLLYLQRDNLQDVEEDEGLAMAS